MSSKNRKIFRTQKGMSLIELLVAISITTLILSLIAGIYVMAMRTFRAESIRSGLETDSRTAIDRMADDIRLAISVPNTIVDPETAEQYNSGPTVLILKVLAIDAANNILYDRFDYIVYKIDTTSLTLIKRTIPYSGSARTLKTENFLTGIISNTSSFTYSPENPPSTNINTVTINLTVSQAGQDKTYSYSTSQEVKLRNK